MTIDFNPEVSKDEILTESLETMTNMIELSQALAAAQNMETIINIVRKSARELVGADGASFVLREGENCYYADEDAIQPLWKGSRFNMDICVSGWAMKNHSVVVIPDILKDDRIPKSIYMATFVRSLLIVPIRTDNPIGAIGCYWAANHGASSFEIQLIQILANITATAMENVLYKIDLAKKAKLLEKAFETTLISISHMIDMRDAYTAGHQNQVSEIVNRIAQAMKLPSDHCKYLSWSALVHDVGKIAIPTEILSKPSKLTALEYELVKTHSKIGYGILKDIEMDFPIAEIILQHHERLDGSGYPNGLLGDQIIIDARILAVADVFEAMVSHRPYRPGLGYDEALAELINR
ncbi:MAG: HD domain-containing protein [Tissierellales bacterium]|nr:HD domain-containing protein [Tissierellales bacterium]MBN2826773.1 HD domain-containing protein [Tissierellales bacterium]